jgi:hypothetical protein
MPTAITGKAAMINRPALVSFNPVFFEPYIFLISEYFMDILCHYPLFLIAAINADSLQISAALIAEFP